MNKHAFEEIGGVQITESSIELHKLLKFENLVQSGGEAKFVIGKWQRIKENWG